MSPAPPDYCSKRGYAVQKCKDLVKKLVGKGNQKQKSSNHRRDLGEDDYMRMYDYLLRHDFEGFALENREAGWFNEDFEE